jgi:hypothetical protein
MTRYNARRAPNPREWLGLDEAERLLRVEQYHRKVAAELPNRRLHASIHVVVENQIALGDETPVGRTVDRLMREGLDRHEAIHAVGSMLADKIFELVRGRFEGEAQEFTDDYFSKVERLTAQGWKRGDFSE